MKSSICKLINETDVFFYKKTDQGWREVLVDVSPEKEYVDFEGLKFLHWHVILLETCVKFPSFIVLFGIVIGPHSWGLS